MRRGIGALSIAMAAVMLLTAARNRAVRPPEIPVVLSATRSFEVTDKPIVTSFTLTRVLTQLIERSGANGLTADQLIRRMFDTQNPRTGSFDAEGPHCDDTLTNGAPSFNGFPRRCPTPEGKLAAVQNLAGQFFTLGLMNRFDQAPPDGSNCGQYRMVFAHKDSETAASTLVRRHLIFEAVLPNPNPTLGLAACRPVAKFWSDLSAVDSMDERRARLDMFFFEGLDGFAPVVDAANFADPGGIRSFVMSGDGATNVSIRFYQFRMAKQCGSAGCTLRFTPDVLENEPFGLLFDGTNTSAQARALRSEFLKHVPTLAIEDLNLMSMKLPKDYLMAESDTPGSPGVVFFEGAFESGKSSSDGISFRANIQSELAIAGSSLTPNNVVVRAEELSCAGCHGFNGAVPFGGNVKLVIGFQGSQMISEDILAGGEAGPLTRYGIDPIIEKQFIPHRMQILTDFLLAGTPPVHSQ